MPMVSRRWEIKWILLDLKEKILHDPDADDLTLYIEELADKITKQEVEREKRVISKLFLDLYERDTAALRRAITKSLVLGADDVSPSDRGLVMRDLCAVLGMYTEKDFADVLALCDMIEEMRSAGEML